MIVSPALSPDFAELPLTPYVTWYTHTSRLFQVHDLAHMLTHGCLVVERTATTQPPPAALEAFNLSPRGFSTST